MKRTLEQIGSGIGVVGFVLCAVAGTARLIGYYHLVGFELITLYEGGIGLMVMGCLAKLHAMGMSGG